MASLRGIRAKIKSVRSTQQITQAMKMVSAARMRRASGAILASRPFAVKLEETVRELARLEAAAQAPAHPFFERRDRDRASLVLVTADKGLCGAFNTNLLRAALDWLRRHRDRKITVVAVGRKGRDFLRRIRDFDFKIVAELVGIFPKVSFAHAELLAKPMLEAYLGSDPASVTVIYNEFKSAIQQRVVEVQLLPVTLPEPGGGPAPADRTEFKFEPGREALLEALLPRFLKAQIYRILLESQAAELAARMNAMDAATENAKELIDGLTLWLNRTRQGMITRELTELVSGAEALVS